MAQGFISLDRSAKPTPEAPYPQATPPSHEVFASIAKGMVDGAAIGQETTLKPEAPNEQFPRLPAGFSLTLEGRSSRGIGGSPLTVLPFDADRVQNRLETAVRTLMLQESRLETEDAPAYTVVNKKAVLPSVLKVTIKGPLGEVKINIPQTASAQYATAADAVRAGDRMLKEGVRRAADQVRTLNEKAGVKA